MSANVRPLKPMTKGMIINLKLWIIHYPDLSGNIPQGEAYAVYISQTLRYARVCCIKEDFMDRMKLLTGKLIGKGYKKPTLKIHWGNV